MDTLSERWYDRKNSSPLVDGAGDKLKPSMTRVKLDLLREKCRLHKVDTTGCRIADDYRQALNEQAPQWEQEEDAPPPRRRAAADADEKKRTSGEVEPPLETSAKKPKLPSTLVATKPDVKER